MHIFLEIILKDYSTEKLFQITETKLPKLNQLYKDLFAGGKGVRARLVRDISSCLALSPDDISLLCESVENIHQSSILHDDVIDSSRFRRNRLATWVKFSKKEAILAGDYLMAQVSFRISENGNLHLLKLTSEAIKNMVQGEWLQREMLGCETLKGLDQVHIFKTSSLFQWSLRAPFLFLYLTHPQLQALLGEIGTLFGQLFQRADDAIDFGIRNKEGKKEFKDLEEGYLNFFGVYIKENTSIRDIKQFRACRSVHQLKKFLGEETLQSQIDSFDRMNDQLSSLCLDRIEKLTHYLDERQIKLIHVLKSWVKLLYLR